MREIPEDELDPGPAGTPPARRARHRPSVWCTAHQTRWDWVPDRGLYIAEDALTNDHPGHAVSATDVGAIPCGETTPVDPDIYPHAGPWPLR